MADDDLELEPETTGGEKGESAPPAAAGRRPSVKSLLIGAGVFGLLASNAFLMYRTLTATSSTAVADEEEAPAESEPEVVPEADLIDTAAVLPLEPLLVNLADSDKNRFVRVRAELVFESEAEMTRVRQSSFATAKAQDATLTLISSKTADELDDVDGRNAFRKELLDVVRKALPGVKVTDVLLTDFIIQF